MTHSGGCHAVRKSTGQEALSRYSAACRRHATPMYPIEYHPRDSYKTKDGSIKSLLGFPHPPVGLWLPALRPLLMTTQLELLYPGLSEHCSCIQTSGLPHTSQKHPRGCLFPLLTTDLSQPGSPGPFQFCSCPKSEGQCVPYFSRPSSP